MKVDELQELHKKRSYRGKNLQGQSFKEKNLSDVDFREADIQGVDFTGAILKGANFTKAKAGLQKRWIIGQSIAALLLTAQQN